MAVFAERDNLDRQQLALKYSQLNGIFEGKDGREYTKGKGRVLEALRSA